MNVIRLVFLFSFLCCTNGVIFAQSRVSASIALNSTTHATCFGNEGSLSVQLTGSGATAGTVIGGYTLVLNKDGAYYNTITNTTIQSSMSIARTITNLPVGIYTISGTIVLTNPTTGVSSGSPSFASINCYVGYQVIWSETKEMAIQPVMSTVLQNIATPTQTYAGARTSNVGAGDCWYSIAPVFNAANATNRSVFVPLFYTGPLGTFNPSTNIDYLEFRKAGSNTSTGDGVYYRVSTSAQGLLKLDGVTYTSKIRVQKTGNVITLHNEQTGYPISVFSTEPFETTNGSNINLSVHTKIINDGVNVGSSFKCKSSEDVYATLFHELDGYYYTMKDGKLRFIFNQSYDTQNNLTFTIYNRAGMWMKNQTHYPPLTATYGENYLTLDLTTASGCIGQGMFILEVINDKKEKTFLRFYNEYTGCTVQSDPLPPVFNPDPPVGSN